MITEKLLQNVLCAADIDHFVQVPISLPCSHYACRACVFSASYQTIKCEICHEINKLDLTRLDESKVVNQLISQYIGELFKILQTKFHESMDTLQENIGNMDKRISLQVTYIKAEIDARIRSLKAQLDAANQALHAELDQTVQQLREKITSSKFGTFDEFSSDLIGLDSNIKQHKSQCEGDLYHYQTKLSKMNKMIEALNFIDPQVKFKVGRTNLDKQTLGSLYSNCQIDNDKTKRKTVTKGLKSGNIELRDLNVQPWDICSINNQHLIVADYTGKELILLDKRFKPQKRINRIGKETFSPIAIIANNENEIYVSDYPQHRIFKTNIDFESATFFGSHGNKTDQLSYPISLCSYNDFIYVCDFGNKRIQKLSSVLTYETSYTLSFHPLQMKIANNIGCVRVSDTETIIFIDLVTSTFTHKYDGHNGMIGTMNSLFYEYIDKSKTICCYDENGFLFDEIYVDSLNDFSIYYGSITSFNDRMMLISDCQNVILI